MNEASSILTYLKAAGLVAAATALAAAIVALTPLESVSAIYMLPVLAAAVRYGTGPAVAAAGLGTLMTTLFYPPIFSVLVVRPPQLIDLGISLIVALTMGRLAGKVRADMLRARDEERRVRQLYGLSSDIAGASGVEAIYAIVAAHIADALARPVALFVGADRSNVRAVHSPFTHDVTLALAAEVEAFTGRNAETPGAETDVARLADHSHWLLCHLGDPQHPQATLAVALERDQEPTPEIIAQARSILAEGAKSLNRLGLSRALEERRLRQRTDALRDILMESVSHELRTPIASVLGSASVLSVAPQIASEPQLLGLSQLIASEAKRLDLRIQNLLDVTRIRSGALQPRFDSIDPADIINAALDSAAERLRERKIVRNFGSDLPLVRVDAVLVEQALINILENAGKFAPAGSSIAISASLHRERLAIDIVDEGPGLDVREAQQVFERFYRGERHADIAEGSGLGLTIAKIFIEANGGEVSALSEGPGRGTTMRIVLPVPPSTPDYARLDDD
ncbi:ATP-binding protein [Bosea sp. BIWAKO-01]|uniref:sensor histidine kinase n=1 Tax=Bosea sp. BIWAKO-01 TaxID=506668 RepID=UPI000853A8F8|nr:ATP-binding protein [Bosea sp. BIWAKO-01]GAU84370.1 osmosensitive K+ channel histidine kinase KdpD [Bosea sp. BIWAKO-01]